MTLLENVKAKIAEIDTKIVALWESGEHGTVNELRHLRAYLAGLLPALGGAKDKPGSAVAPAAPEVAVRLEKAE